MPVISHYLISVVRHITSQKHIALRWIVVLLCGYLYPVGCRGLMSWLYNKNINYSYFFIFSSILFCHIQNILRRRLINQSSLPLAPTAIFSTIDCNCHRPNHTIGKNAIAEQAMRIDSFIISWDTAHRNAIEIRIMMPCTVLRSTHIVHALDETTIPALASIYP